MLYEIGTVAAVGTGIVASYGAASITQTILEGIIDITNLTKAQKVAFVVGEVVISAVVAKAAADYVMNTYEEGVELLERFGDKIKEANKQRKLNKMAKS